MVLVLFMGKWLDVETPSSHPRHFVAMLALRLDVGTSPRRHQLPMLESAVFYVARLYMYSSEHKPRQSTTTSRAQQIPTARMTTQHAERGMGDAFIRQSDLAPGRREPASSRE
jgi:hypothetical protein